MMDESKEIRRQSGHKDCESDTSTVKPFPLIPIIAFDTAWIICSVPLPVEIIGAIEDSLDFGRRGQDASKARHVVVISKLVIPTDCVGCSVCLVLEHSP